MNLLYSIFCFQFLAYIKLTGNGARDGDGACHAHTYQDWLAGSVASLVCLLFICPLHKLYFFSFQPHTPLLTKPIKKKR